MNNLLRDIAKEVVIAAKQGPRIYFEPFVLVFKTICGAIQEPGHSTKKFKRGSSH